MRSDVAYVYVRDLIERLTGVKPEPDVDGDLNRKGFLAASF